MKFSEIIWSIGLSILMSATQWLQPVAADELARGKPATQSGTFGIYNASRAVDGDPTTCCIACSTCNGYQPSGVPGWILIDLGVLYTVTDVTLVNSVNTEDSKYMENFRINVINAASSDIAETTPGDLCYYYNNGSFVVSRLAVNCLSPLIGRYVAIRRVDGYRRDALSVCEALVYGYLGSTITSSTTTTTSSSSSSSLSVTRTTRTTTVSTINRNSTSNPNVRQTASTGPPPPANNNSSAFSSSSSGGLSRQALGAIIGVVVGVTVVVIGLIIFCICIKMPRRQNKSSFLRRRQSQKPIIVEDSSSVYAANACITDAPGRLINKSMLSNYVTELRSTLNGFQKEFKRLPEENAAEAKIGQLPDNRLKNRYINVLPYDHTIVNLEVEQLDEDVSTYINANFIAGYKKTAQAYIAAQGPRPNTINDFWRMIWQKQVNVIVMITQLIEKTKNKCEMYWPEKIGEEKRYHRIFVTLASEEFFADYVERKLVICDDRREEHERSRTVRQMQYLSWLDNTRPQHCFQLLSFRKMVKKLQADSSGPILVHCSSGIGRTGAYIALDYLLDQVVSEGSLSVFSCVEELRRQRMNMVQTQDQYEFIYDALVDAIEFGDTSKSCEEFIAYYNDTRNISTFERQLEQLKKFSEPKPGRKSAGLDRENLSKNRNNAIVAYDDSRTYLDVSYISRSDYVNAVSVSSHHSAHAYILTQVPLRETIVDFWRLIWDYELTTIVLLDDLTESHTRYWTESSGSRTHGPFLVEMTSSEEESRNVWKREFILTNTKDKHRESICVHQFELRDWLKRAMFQSEDVNLLFELRKELADHLELQPTSERIVIQCMDGSTKSGLFTAALHVIDRILSETRVDVCLSCRNIRIHRPNAVDNMDHFMFLHEVACFCCRQTSPNPDGHGFQLKRLSLSTLYASVRSTNPNAFDPANFSR